MSITDELREVDRLQTENAKLREQIHWLKQGDILHVLTDQEYIDQCEREHLMQVSIDALDKENAKLRELCAGLWTVMWACAEQRCPHRHEDCYVVRGNGGVPKSHGECWYKQRMREMGVSAE